jgi:ABC-type phosphate transport system substrate-binding protein
MEFAMSNVSKIVCSICFIAISGVVQADIVAVVSAKSPVAALTKDQLSDIFLGKAATFPGGGQAVPIEQAEGAQHDAFHSKVTGKDSTKLRAYWSRQIFSGTGTPPKEVPDGSEVKKLVSANPNMIGYVDKSTVDASLKVVFAP